MRSSLCFSIALGLAAALPASRGEAIVHTWDIAEIYSSADGSVQFIEFFTTNSGEIAWGASQIFTDANFVDHDVPPLPAPTTNKRVLVATEGFANLEGAVQPDFAIPGPLFFSVDGDTIVFADGSGTALDTVSFGDGPGLTPLPIDGVMSLHRELVMPSPQGPTSAPPEGLFVAENSPTNYAGEVGRISVPEPRAAWVGVAAVLVLGSGCRRTLARRTARRWATLLLGQDRGPQGGSPSADRPRERHWNVGDEA